MSKDPASLAHSEQFDVCMIFPATPEGHFQDEGLQILRNIQYYLGEANVYAYQSVDAGEIIVLLRVEESVMKAFASSNSKMYLADKDNLKSQASQGWPAKGVAPLTIESDTNITRYEPFEYIYLKYKDDPAFEHLYAKSNGKTIFTEVERINIIYEILTGQHELGGCQLRFGPLIKAGVLLSVYALHDREALQQLKNKFHGPQAMLVPWAQPYDAIKGYFGEKVTVYFKFMGHFSLYMMIPAVVGLATQLVILESYNLEHPIAAIYSIFICLWGVAVMEFWKRTEKFVAMEHGMVGYEAKEAYRAEFEEDKVMYLTGTEILYFPSSKRKWLLVQSYTIVGFFCCIVVGTLAGIYKFKSIISSTSEELAVAASTVASIMTSLQILFYGAIYDQISGYLTDRENHRTHTEHEDSMIAKNFLFAFVNSYASFFFIAFFAAWLPKPTYPGEGPDGYTASFQGQCGSASCVETLTINLGIILAIDIFVGDILELLVPYLSEQFKLQKELAGAHPHCELSPAEREFAMDEYSDKEMISDYMEVAVLFGYMTMFVAALPGSTLVVLLFLIIEIKVDIWKLTHLMRRPWPRGAEDIGTWQTIFELVVTAAVITNAGMIVFTMEMVSQFSTFTQLWIFIGFQWVVFTIQGLIRVAVPDVPMEVELQLKRQEFFNVKLIDQISDSMDHMKHPTDKDTFYNMELTATDDEKKLAIERAMGRRRVKLNDDYINRMNSMVKASAPKASGSI